MTPRSRKPVMMVSTSNLCSLVTNSNNDCDHNPVPILHGSNVDALGAINCASILEESQMYNNSTDNALLSNVVKDTRVQDTENNRLEITLERNNSVNVCLSVAKCHTTTTQRSSVSTTTMFREYLLSRSVLTTSPVDLSFTSRTDDFEQSESDLNILNDEDTLSDSLLCCLDGNQPDTSDTSGIASGSTNSANNSTDKNSEESSSPRKRGSSLQRNDSKRSAKESKEATKKHQHLKHRHPSNELSIVNMKDSFQETSF